MLRGLARQFGEFFVVDNDFVTAVSRYRNVLGEEYSDIDTLRLETHVESLRDWSCTGDLSETIAWFEEQQRDCEMVIDDIPLSECAGWSVDQETGWIGHESGEFFYVQGVRISSAGSREVGARGWDQPILTQVGYDGGILGLLRKRFDGVPHYLVEAKAEPGNPDKVQISPTLQATFSNLRRAHSGRRPRFAEYFEKPDEFGGVVHFDQWMSEDGGRLHLKRNRGMLVEVPVDHEVDSPAGFRWLSLYQIKELIKRNSWVNPHVRGIISHL